MQGNSLLQLKIMASLDRFTHWKSDMRYYLHSGIEFYDRGMDIRWERGNKWILMARIQINPSMEWFLISHRKELRLEEISMRMCIEFEETCYKVGKCFNPAFAGGKNDLTMRRLK